VPKLSVAAIEKLKPHSSKRREVPDAGKPGLFLVIHKTGRKSWAVRYRINRQTRKLTLPGFPSLPTARALAQAALDEVAEGRDPALQKKAANSSSNVIEHVFAEFMARHVKKRNGAAIRESSRRETGRLLGLKPATPDLATWEPRKPWSGVLAKWHGRNVLTITKRDVLALVDSFVSNGAPVGANRTLAAVKTAFGWCVRRDILATSPADRVDAPSPERSAERAMSDSELVAIWRAAEAMGYPYGRTVQLLMVTGQRRDEVREAPRREFDLANAVWKLPPERTKNGRAHHVPLSATALAILKGLPAVQGEAGLLFSLNGEVPFSNLARLKTKLDVAALAELRKLDPAAKLKPWRLHDLRHTLKTWMQSARVPKDVRNAVQNHFDGDMDELYGHYTFEKEKREALDAWARHIEALLSGQGGNVVSMRR
jgi:integrase